MSGSTSHRREIVLIAPMASQPRYHKRSAQLAQARHVKVFAFQRDLYEQNRFPSQLEFVSLGRIRDGHYHRRVSKMLRAAQTIRAQIANSSVEPSFYALGFDCLAIARSSGLRHGFLELGDLWRADSSSRLWLPTQKWLLQNARGLVLTSRYFARDYYHGRGAITDSSRVYVIENKVHWCFSGRRPLLASRPLLQPHAPRDGPIRVGLLGLLRYAEPIGYLLRYAQAYPQRIVVECHGDGPLATTIAQCADRSSRIRFHGSFKNPEDLQSLYAGIDVNFAVYDGDRLNVRLALPNKLYESAFFQVPILACRGTAAARVARRWGMGSSIELDSYANFSRSMDKALERSLIIRQTRHCALVPESQLIDDGHRTVHRMLETPNLGSADGRPFIEMP